MRLAADYTYSTRDNSSTTGQGVPQAFSTNGEIFGGNYSENTFRLTLRLAL